jgi:hypothetical protein
LLRALLARDERYGRCRDTVAERGRLGDHARVVDTGIGRHQIGVIARTLGRRAA